MLEILSCFIAIIIILIGLHKALWQSAKREERDNPYCRDEWKGRKK